MFREQEDDQATLPWLPVVFFSDRCYNIAYGFTSILIQRRNLYVFAD